MLIMVVVAEIVIEVVELFPIALLGRMVIVVGLWVVATMATRRQTIRP